MLNFVQKKFNVSVTIVIAEVIFLVFMLGIAHNYSQSERFSDEVAHFVGGHFMLKGKTLYKDLQLNHQPLNYLFSAVVEKISFSSNLYYYIGHQRIAVFLYGALWNLAFIIFFGPIAILFTIIFEFSKYWFSGYKLLAETIAVYPLIFMFGIVAKRRIYGEKLTRFYACIFSICTFLVFFSLMTLWPLVLYLNIVTLLSLKSQKKIIAYSVAPFFFLSVALFLIVPLNYYIKETVIYNFLYFIPGSIKKFSYVNVLLFPFKSLLPPYSSIQFIISACVILLGLLSYFAYKKKKLLVWLLVIVGLVLANSRVDNYDYNNFHVLPWYGVLLFITVYGANLFNSIKKYLLIKKIYLGILILMLFLVYFETSKTISKRKNVLTEYYINYSQSESYGKAIKILKNDSDTLMAIPNDPIIYYVADIKPATKILEHYAWVFLIPEYMHAVTDALKSNRVQFIVNTGESFSKEVKYIIDRDYIQLTHLHKPSKLYVMKKKIKDVSNAQWIQLESMLYEKPTE